ncbi:GNAT family N-acetyltransferase [Cytobacillus spongiae]|uniref:GNAT family N-acetyltransferase n=1 Tax=Cytobacillus spongiae TaxID=2901381 RepID=UPI001F42493F|nr:GNAT family N-acetyltransferase [Cytobacillus spongiae]UII57525.1 GNAT family N-acetyltransferase [Cytobacillus spongiae]
MTIRLEAVTQVNWKECVNLKVASHQQAFVATNLYSLAESKFEPTFIPVAIYVDEHMVGFLMYGQDPEDEQYWLIRLMVDESYQGKGYGREASKELITLLRTKPDITSLKVSYTPDNVGAEALYLSLGFEKTGEVLDDETVALLTL